jgi:DNA replication regulator DPB11
MLPQYSAQNQDDADEELASITRLPAVTLQLWGSLLKPRGYEISDGELFHSPSKAYAAPKPVLQQPPPTPVNNVDGGGSVVVQCRCANSFAPVRPDAPPSSRPLPFKRAKTVAALGNHVDEGSGDSFMAPAISVPQEKNGESSTSGRSDIFSGLKFLVLGEAKTTSVRSAVELNGGKWCAGDEDEVDYVVVRLVRWVSSSFLDIINEIFSH